MNWLTFVHILSFLHLFILFFFRGGGGVRTFENFGILKLASVLARDLKLFWSLNHYPLTDFFFFKFCSVGYEKISIKL